MDIKTIMAALGVSSEADVLPALTAHMTLSASLQTLTGEKTGETILAAIKDDRDIAASVKKQTGADDKAAIFGKLTGWEASASKVTELEAAAKQRAAAEDTTKIKALLDEQCPPGKRESVDAFVAEHSLAPAAVEKMLANMSIPIANSKTGQPITQTAVAEGATVQLTDVEIQAAELTGRTKEDAISAKTTWAKATQASGGKIAVIHDSEVKSLDKKWATSANPNLIPRNRAAAV